MSGLEAAAVGFLTGLGASAGVATTIVAIAKIAAAVTAATFIAKRAADYDPGLQARGVTTRGSDEPQQLVYGQALVSGPVLIPPQVSGIRNRELWNVVGLAGHELDQISDVWLDGRVISNSEINSGNVAGGVVNAGEFNRVRNQTVAAIYKHYGTSTQTVDTNLQAAIGSGVWTNNHRLRGLAYLVTSWVLWDRTENLWETGEPTNVRALVRGKKVYDPRLDSTQPGGSGAHRVSDPTTWAWSDNPALCTADFLRDTKFGPGFDESRINWSSVQDAADDCDVLVSIPGATTQKRFTCNGAVFGAADPDDNLAALLSSFLGSVSFDGNQFYIRAGVYVAPDAGDTVTSDDLIGTISKNQALEPSERVNTIKCKFVDPNKSYKVNETLPITAQAYLDRDDGDVLEQSLELPFTNSWFEAQRIGIKKLAEANLEETYQVPVNLRCARFVTGQRINCTIPRLPAIVKVIGWKLIFSGEQMGVELTLRKDESTAYADPLDTDYDTELANGTLVDAELEPIPGLDTVPEGIRYGAGAWNCQITPNQDAIGGANDGEIRIQTGVFIPDAGNRRPITQTAVNTSFEGSTTPPDGRFFLIWGTTNALTRFGAGFQSLDVFPAILDRSRGQWYAVNNNNVEVAFTPADTDYVVARGIKTSASGGIDYLTAVVPYVEDPEATVGATWDVDVVGQPADADILNENTDWSDVSGTTNAPEDNATVGANANNFEATYVADANSSANLIATDTDTNSTSSATYVTLRTINVRGVGQLRVEFDASSAADPLTSDEQSFFRFTQGQTVLTTSPATLSLRSNGNWVTDAIDCIVTIDNADDAIRLQARNGDSFLTRIRNIDVYTDSILGENFS